MQGLQECIPHIKCDHTVLYNTNSLTKEKITFLIPRMSVLNSGGAFILTVLAWLTL
jgi:hypothetical protein